MCYPAHGLLEVHILPIESAKIAMIPAHVRESVEEVDRTRRRDDSYAYLSPGWDLGGAGSEMGSSSQSEVEWRWRGR